MATSASGNAYLDSAPLHLGRGFRHICFTASSASGNAYLDSASLHLGRGFRHMHFTATSASSNAYLDSAPLISVVAFATYVKKRKGLLECKHSSDLSSFFPALLNA